MQSDKGENDLQPALDNIKLSRTAELGMNHLAFWTESTDSRRRFDLKEWFIKLGCNSWLWRNAVLVHC